MSACYGRQMTHIPLGAGKKKSIFSYQGWKQSLYFLHLYGRVFVSFNIWRWRKCFADAAALWSFSNTEDVIEDNTGRHYSWNTGRWSFFLASLMFPYSASKSRSLHFSTFSRPAAFKNSLWFFSTVWTIVSIYDPSSAFLGVITSFIIMLVQAHYSAWNSCRVLCKFPKGF